VPGQKLEKLKKDNRKQGKAKQELFLFLLRAKNVWKTYS